MAAGFAVCDLCDAHENDSADSFRVLPPVFKDFGGLLKFCGQVETVRCLEDNSKVKEMVSKNGEGRVLVVEGGGSVRRALLGGNLATEAQRNGWAGVLVDGAVRDIEELRGAKIGIRALALMPMRSTKRGEGQIGIPVFIQGVPVTSGDYLYADEDGIVISKEKLV